MASVRITAGTLRGRRLNVPRGDVRPTSERARQAFFNIVSDRIAGSKFLDLFAGSGVFSFEAVSRGAAGATAVESDRRAVETITRTAKEWSVPVSAVAGDALRALGNLSTTFDVVYADPPYDYDAYDDLLAAIDAAPLAPEPVVAIEHRRRTNPFTSEPSRLRFKRRAEYGEVWITFFA